MSIVDRIRGLFGSKGSGADSTALIGGSVAATAGDDSREDADSHSDSSEFGGSDSGGGADAEGGGGGDGGGGGSG